MAGSYRRWVLPRKHRVYKSPHNLQTGHQATTNAYSKAFKSILKLSITWFIALQTHRLWYSQQSDLCGAAKGCRCILGVQCSVSSTSYACCFTGKVCPVSEPATGCLYATNFMLSPVVTSRKARQRQTLQEGAVEYKPDKGSLKASCK